MKPLIFLVLITLVVVGCESTSNVEDPANTHFIKFYGRDGDQTGRDLVVLPDGSMVLFGTSKPTVSPNGTQWFVVRVDAKGVIMWEREYGGPQDEEARDIEYTSTGNLVLVGNSHKALDDRDVLVMTLNPADGSKIDSALHYTLDLGTSLPTLGDEDASTVSEIAGGFIIAGTTTYVDPANPPHPTLLDSHDAMMLRLNTDLTLYPNSWKQINGKGGDDGFIKILPAPVGAHQSFYAFGYSDINEDQNTVGYDYWVIYFGTDGVENSDNFYLGSSAADEKMSSFAFTGSQLLMTGLQVGASTDVYFASAFLPQADTLVLQFPEKTLGLNLGSNLTGHTSICQASVNGGFYILAEENGFNNNQNWILTRLNNNGTPGWSLPIVYGGEGFDSAGAVKELPDGRVVIIGTMRTGRPDAGEYKMTLIKVNGEGKFEK